MRARIIAPVAVTAGLIICGAMAFRHPVLRRADPMPVASQEKAVAISTPSEVIHGHRGASPTFTPSMNPSRVQAPPEDDGEVHETFDHAVDIAERVGMLEELSRSTNPVDLTPILIDLKNPELKIRRAAVRAAADFGSAEAIPDLQSELSMTDDPEEQTNLQSAIEFLQLSPTAPRGH